MIPEGLKETWEEAESLIAANSFDEALESLRKAWSEFGKDANHANTWNLAGDATRGKAADSEQTNRKLLRKAHEHYQMALKLNPKHREARRSDNALLIEMDGLGIRATSLPRLWADGTPTVYGLFAIVVVGMLMLTSLKYMPEIKDFLGLSSESSGDWDATLTIELYPEAAPKTVDSFKDHAVNGRYDGIAFHRVIDGFMVQGGDISYGAYPLAEQGPGTGGYSAIWYGQGQQGDMTTWTMPDEFHPSYRHAPGVLAMANSGANTGGSQFYLVDKDSTPSHLDDKHSVFGIATGGTYLGSDLGGIGLVDKLSQVPTDKTAGTCTDGGQPPCLDRPIDSPYIHSIEISGDTAYMHIVFP